MFKQPNTKLINLRWIKPKPMLFWEGPARTLFSVEQKKICPRIEQTSSFDEAKVVGCTLDPKVDFFQNGQQGTSRISSALTANI